MLGSCSVWCPSHVVRCCCVCGCCVYQLHDCCPGCAWLMMDLLLRCCPAGVDVQHTTFHTHTQCISFLFPTTIACKTIQTISNTMLYTTCLRWRSRVQHKLARCLHGLAAPSSVDGLAASGLFGLSDLVQPSHWSLLAARAVER